MRLRRAGLAITVAATAACGQKPDHRPPKDDRAAVDVPDPTPVDPLGGPEPGLRGPLASVRFWMTGNEVIATNAPITMGPGLVPDGIAYVGTWAPCGDDQRLQAIGVDVPAAALDARLQGAWGGPQRDDDVRCWFAEDTGIRACIGTGIPFGRKGYVTVQLEPFVPAKGFVAGEDRSFAVTRGPILARPVSEATQRFSDRCVGHLYVGDDAHVSIRLPPTRWGTESTLVLERDPDDRVARAVLLAATWNDDERARIVEALQTRFGPGTPGHRGEASGDKETLTWPGDPEIRLAHRPGVVRILIGPWGDRWSIEPPSRPTDDTP